MAKHQPPTVRKAQLFQAALEVCAEKGYHAARVEDIVERAGLSKGSLYHHFKSKQELFLGLLQSMVDEFKDLMAETVRQSRTASEALRRATHQFMQSLEAHSGLPRAMTDLFVLAVRDPVFRETFHRYYEELVETAVPVIQQGIERGEFDPTIDPRRISWLFFTAGDGLVLVNLMLGRTDQGTKAMDDLLDLFIRALKPRGADDSTSSPARATTRETD